MQNNTVPGNIHPNPHYKKVQSILSGSTIPYRTSDELSETQYDFSIKEILVTAWRYVDGFKLNYFLGGLIYWAVSMASYIGLSVMMTFLSFILILLMAGGNFDQSFSNPNSEGAFFVILYGMQFIFQLIVMIPLNILAAGLGVLSIKWRNNLGNDLVGDLFSPFKRFGTLVLLQLILMIGTFVGLILFIIPGMYFIVATLFSMWLALVYPELSAWQSLKLSIKLVNRHFFKILGLLFVLLGISLLILVPILLILVYVASIEPVLMIFALLLLIPVMIVISIWLIPFMTLSLASVFQKMIERPAMNSHYF